MKPTIAMLAFAAAAGAALPSPAMPIGLRTAAWSVSAANGRAAVARLLPETAAEAEIARTLEAFADDALAQNISGAGEYGEFREWALSSGARADALAESPAAWLSFAAGSPVLAAPPEDGDLTIDAVSPPGPDGTIELVVSLKGVAIDGNALEARLKSVFGVSGGTEPADAKTSGADCKFALAPTEDGRLRVMVSPGKDGKGGMPDRFFLRVKVK